MFVASTVSLLARFSCCVAPFKYLCFAALAAGPAALSWILFTFNCKKFSITHDLFYIVLPVLYEFSYSTLHTITVLYGK